MLVKERLIWADSLKGILIILVILGHAMQECLGEKVFANHLWNIIYSFHMPAFMAISGYLSFRIGNKYKYSIVLWRRFRQLVIPFLIWTIINKCVHGTFTLLSIWEIIYDPSKGLWFLWVLFLIYVFFNFGLWLSDKFKIYPELVHSLMCISFVGMMAMFGVSVFGIQLVAYYFLFYTIGFYTHKYFSSFIHINGLLLIFLFFVWFILAWYWSIESVPALLAGIPLPKTILNYSYRFISAFIAIYLLMAVFPKYMNKHSFTNGIICFWGRLSLGIYTVHLIVLGDIFSVIDAFLFCNFLKISLTFVVVGGVSLLLVHILSKNGVTAKWLLGKI